MDALPVVSWTPRGRPPRPDACAPVTATGARHATDPTEATRHAFDRETDEVVPPDYLKSYRHAMARYHRHPGAKFRNGEPLDSGLTERRHVKVTGIVAIGKEANRWEEQFFLGEDPQVQIIYGQSSRDRERQRQEMRGEIERWGVRRLSRESELSLGLVSGIKRGTKRLTERSAQRLSCAIARLRAEEGDTRADGD